MGLPKLNHPTFTLTLPSTKQEIVYRPFLVREEKLLLMAQQARDVKDVVRAIKQVITNCIVSPELDVDEFTTFDLEYFYLKLRARSVNNVVSLTYRDSEDNKEYKFEVDLDRIEIVSDPAHTNIVQINETMKLVLKYPSLELMDIVPKSGVEYTFDILHACLDKLLVGEEDVFLFSEQTKGEVEEFMASLSIETFKGIQHFFDTMPKIEHVLEYTNDNGRKTRIELRKLDDFFTLA